MRRSATDEQNGTVSETSDRVVPAYSPADAQADRYRQQAAAMAAGFAIGGGCDPKE